MWRAAHAWREHTSAPRWPSAAPTTPRRRRAGAGGSTRTPAPRPRRAAGSPSRTAWACVGRRRGRREPRAVLGARRARRGRRRARGPGRLPPDAAGRAPRGRAAGVARDLARREAPRALPADHRPPGPARAGPPAPAGRRQAHHCNRQDLLPGGHGVGDAHQRAGGRRTLWRGVSVFSTRRCAPRCGSSGATTARRSPTTRRSTTTIYYLRGSAARRRTRRCRSQCPQAPGLAWSRSSSTLVANCCLKRRGAGAWSRSS